MPNCQLCGLDKQLIKAHVIPESFLMLPSSDEGRPAKIVSSIAGMPPKKTRTGIYDSNILCGECDAKLGVLDQHAVEHLIRVREVSDLNLKDELARQYVTADPELLQRFVLSVAWRASISAHYFFNRVDLGPYDGLIASILNGSPDKAFALRTMIAEFDKDDPSILSPHSIRAAGARIWLIYANRFIFYVVTDKRPVPSPFSDFALKPGHPVISVVRPWLESKERAAMKKAVHANSRAYPRRA